MSPGRGRAGARPGRAGRGVRLRRGLPRSACGGLRAALQREHRAQRVLLAVPRHRRAAPGLPRLPGGLRRGCGRRRAPLGGSRRVRAQLRDPAAHALHGRAGRQHQLLLADAEGVRAHHAPQPAPPGGRPRQAAARALPLLAAHAPAAVLLHGRGPPHRGDLHALAVPHGRGALPQLAAARRHDAVAAGAPERPGAARRPPRRARGCRFRGRLRRPGGPRARAALEAAGRPRLATEAARLQHGDAGRRLHPEEVRPGGREAGGLHRPAVAPRDERRGRAGPVGLEGGRRRGGPAPHRLAGGAVEAAAVARPVPLGREGCAGVRGVAGAPGPGEAALHAHGAPAPAPRPPRPPGAVQRRCHRGGPARGAAGGAGGRPRGRGVPEEQQREDHGPRLAQGARDFQQRCWQLDLGGRHASVLRRLP
mmetsp:Transcript_121439/g.329845  ORF Transcript_121439/g.329845 Transcript_121439/m.329845 type:complete len:422 (+) Transcript_121439:691-1956(+)